MSGSSDNTNSQQAQSDPDYMRWALSQGGDYGGGTYSDYLLNKEVTANPSGNLAGQTQKFNMAQGGDYGGGSASDAMLAQQLAANPTDPRNQQLVQFNMAQGGDYGGGNFSDMLMNQYLAGPATNATQTDPDYMRWVLGYGQPVDLSGPGNKFNQYLAGPATNATQNTTPWSNVFAPTTGQEAPVTPTTSQPSWGLSSTPFDGLQGLLNGGQSNTGQTTGGQTTQNALQTTAGQTTQNALQGLLGTTGNNYAQGRSNIDEALKRKPVQSWAQNLTGY